MEGTVGRAPADRDTATGSQGDPLGEDATNRPKEPGPNDPPPPAFAEPEAPETGAAGMLADQEGPEVPQPVRLLDDDDEDIGPDRHLTIESFKAWVRNEIRLSAQGHSIETRMQQNP